MSAPDLRADVAALARCVTDLAAHAQQFDVAAAAHVVWRRGKAVADTPDVKATVTFPPPVTSPASDAVAWEPSAEESYASLMLRVFRETTTSAVAIEAVRLAIASGAVVPKAVHEAMAKRAADNFEQAESHLAQAERAEAALAAAQKDAAERTVLFSFDKGIAADADAALTRAEQAERERDGYIDRLNGVIREREAAIGRLAAARLDQRTLALLREAARSDGADLPVRTAMYGNGSHHMIPTKVLAAALDAATQIATNAATEVAP